MDAGLKKILDQIVSVDHIVPLDRTDAADVLEMLMVIEQGMINHGSPASDIDEIDIAIKHIIRHL
jgi:hypothetical protein